MTIEGLFRELEPPAGGLDRLRSRLRRTQPGYSPHWLPAAVAGSLLLAVVWIWQVDDGSEETSVAELRAVLAAAAQPPLSIDGASLVRVDVASEHAEIYWLGDPP
ncbi:MAG: hypothetical protein JJU31_10640 [Wenzhouxiangella sp.]|nr:hypothetical protein [Wenzhouxiangella sp.]